MALALCIPSALVQQLELPLFSRPAAIRVGGLSDPLDHGRDRSLWPRTNRIQKIEKVTWASSPKQILGPAGQPAELICSLEGIEEGEGRHYWRRTVEERECGLASSPLPRSLEATSHSLARRILHAPPRMRSPPPLSPSFVSLAEPPSPSSVSWMPAVPMTSLHKRPTATNNFPQIMLHLSRRRRRSSSPTRTATAPDYVSPISVIAASRGKEHHSGI